MTEHTIKRIRTAAEACLSGLDARPSLESRVRERIQGTRRAPVRLSAAVAVALLAVVLAAAALAAGMLAGWFRIGQEQVGALRGCAAVGDTLYLMTSDGLHAWTAEDAQPRKVLSAEELLEQGLTFETLLFSHDGAVGLLHEDTKTVWSWRSGQLTQLLSYAGTQLDLPGMRFTAAVCQDGWLFLCALPRGATAYEACVYRISLTDARTEMLAVDGVVELCAGKPGQMFALAADPTGNKEQLLALDSASGAVNDVLYTAPLQGMCGIAWDADSETLYATVGGELSRWRQDGWETLQGYAEHHLAYAYAVVGNGYATVSHDGMQYMPFAPAESLPTLRIRGYIAAGNDDAAFQDSHPGAAVVREAAPALTGQDVIAAIQNGDTTDLFHVRLDGDLARAGWTAPLQSDALQQDVQQMLPMIRDAVCPDGTLYALPSTMTVLTWQSDSVEEQSFDELLALHGGWQQNRPLIAYPWMNRSWGKAEYVEYLLSACILEGADMQTYLAALQRLRDARLPEPLDSSQPAVILTRQAVSLGGERMEEESRNFVPGENAPSSEAPYWMLPSRIDPQTKPHVPAQLVVYVLNPNAAQPELALDYLQHVAANRPPDTEALLKPDAAQPTLHPGVEKWLKQIEDDQRAYDAQQGVKTDEAALQARLDAVRAAPDSWAVEAARLQAYRETIAPWLDLQLHPLLSASSKQEDGVWTAMLEISLRFVRREIEECSAELESLGWPQT